MRPFGPPSDHSTSSASSSRLRRGSTRIALVCVAVAGMIATVLAVPPAQASVAPLPAPNGTSEASAAASCWEIKQVTPSAPSGVYWLNTPQLGAPEQFYCDQTTSGGGWVLIGRGRNGWSTSNAGFGTPASVRSPITGQAAFQPRQLSAKKIDALLNGGAVRSLDDGVRLRRATDSAGTSWQEVTFKYSSPRDHWSWMFDNEQRVGAWRVGSSSGSGGLTSSFGSGSTVNRVQTTMGEQQGWSDGFGFGSSSRGTPSDSTYIWAPTTTSPNPRPFTQVFLRPKLSSSSIFPAIPTSGTPQRENIAIADSMALPTVWGVTGIGAGPLDLEGSNEVSAFAESNGVMYVGGNFTTVQRNATGTGAVNQPYLAAFNVSSGEWISSFRPTLNNQVKSLAALPDGRIAVGGYFTRVNGADREGLVVLSPTTGATDASFNGRLINRLSGGLASVRGMDVQGNWLYLAGSFTHSVNVGSGVESYTRSGARFSAVTGTPDGSWNPEFNGTSMAVDASSQGDRTYYSGYFTQSRGVDAIRAAAVTTASPSSVIPWTIDFSQADTGKTYQQTVKEVGSRVWVGGAQHMFYSYNRANMAELGTNITKAGGDFQASTSNGEVVYGGCHCYHTNYVGARRYPTVGTGWTEASKINSVGAWSATTGQYLPEFSPTTSTREGAGAWALLMDSNGTLWSGGDFTHSLRAGFVKQWSGGFIRYAQVDAQAPTRPSRLSASDLASGVRLSWTGSTDNRGPISYQVLRQDRVVATTTSTTIDLPGAPAGTNYFVRAADPDGNWSASTPAAQVGDSPPPPDPDSSVLIGAGSTWSYWYDLTGPAAGWASPSFNETGWSSGPAPIGYGQSTLGTTLTTDGTKPLASYYRKSLTIGDADAIASVNLETRADDGIVVYVNGVEVVRANMGSGTPTPGTYATASPSAATALANPITVNVPGSAFRDGTNVIAAEVHSGYRSTPSHSFELTATISAEAAAPPPPPEPADPEALIAAGSSWNYWYNSNDPAAGWASMAFDQSGWPVGAAPLGYGQTDLGTILSGADPKPLASYYRHSFTVSDVTAFSSVSIVTRADDGIVVYVNGVEVLRNNIGPGPVTPGTYALSSPNATTAVSTPITVTVPASAFVTGTNLIAAEVHSGYRSTPSHSFELTATAG